MAGKADGLAAMAREAGLPLAQCAFIGDNVNDLDVMRAAGLAIAVHVKHPDVARTADLVIESTDLRALLPLFPGPQKP
jgi:N-acylneuraminate cytidylyltransferase